MSNLVPQFKITKANGIWTVHQPDSLAKFKIDAKDGEYFLSIAPPKSESRSQRQNRFYWSVIVKLLGEHLGNHREEMHAIFGDLFLKETFMFKGKEITYLKSTTGLSVGEMSGYIELCIQVASENGCPIPDPDSVDY